MKISKRILYYLIGFGIGLIFTIILFQGRGCEWTPGNRVKTSLQSSKILISDQEKCKLKCLSIPDAEIFEMVNHGDVDFGKSDTKSSIHTFEMKGVKMDFEVLKYYMSHKNKELFFWYSKADSTVILHTLESATSKCTCDSLSATDLSILYMPNDLILSTLQSQELWINKEMQCQLKCFDLTETHVKEMLEKGEVLILESFPNRKPNPIYFIKYPINGVQWVFWVEKGATKTRLVHMADMSGIVIKENEYLVNKLFTKIQEENVCGCYK
jgi:hypothetical protein